MDAKIQTIIDMRGEKIQSFKTEVYAKRGRMAEYLLALYEAGLITYDEYVYENAKPRFYDVEA